MWLAETQVKPSHTASQGEHLEEIGIKSGCRSELRHSYLVLGHPRGHFTIAPNAQPKNFLFSQSNIAFYGYPTFCS